MKDPKNRVFSLGSSSLSWVAQRTFLSDLILAEERERRQIAVGLHDDIGQSPALTKMRLQALLKNPQERLPRDLIEDFAAPLDDLIRKTRSLTMEISPPMLYELGLEAALEWLFERYGEDFGLRIDYAGWPAKDVPEELAIFLYRAARELLTNVVKHAGADLVSIVLRRKDGSVHLDVEDDGRGFISENALAGGDRQAGFGLFSIEERAIALGGRVEIDSAPAKGTRVRVSVPLSFSPTTGPPHPVAGNTSTRLQ